MKEIDTKPTDYMPQLDTLRAFTVLAVLIHHLLNKQYLPGYLANLSLGLFGVQLFFVLSGFLTFTVKKDC